MDFLRNIGPNIFGTPGNTSNPRGRGRHNTASARAAALTAQDYQSSPYLRPSPSSSKIHMPSGAAADLEEEMSNPDGDELLSSKASGSASPSLRGKAMPPAAGAGKAVDLQVLGVAAQAMYDRLGEKLESMPEGPVAKEVAAKMLGLRTLLDGRDAGAGGRTQAGLSEKARGKLAVGRGAEREKREGGVDGKEFGPGGEDEEMEASSGEEGGNSLGSFSEDEGNVAMDYTPSDDKSSTIKTKLVAPSSGPGPRAPGLPTPPAPSPKASPRASPASSSSPAPLSTQTPSRTTPQTPNTTPLPHTQTKRPGPQANVPKKPSPLSQSHPAPSTDTPMANPTDPATRGSGSSKTAHAVHARFGRGQARSRMRWLTRDDPHYAMTDAEMRDSLWQMMDLMDDFARAYFGFPTSEESVPAQAFAGMGLETAKVIGCVASAGPGGVAGWHALFTEKGQRQALVCAVLGNVLVEQVFGHVLFGGEGACIEELGRMQERLRDEDGFERNAQYAAYIAHALEKKKAHDDDDDDDEHVPLPANFNRHVVRVIAALWTHLKPIYRMGWVHRDTTPIPQRVFQALHRIVTLAGLLSLVMRLDQHSVYHFEPMFKEEAFDADRMDCYNMDAMQQRNPRTPLDAVSEAEQVRRARLSAAEKARARMDRPLTQMVLMAGVRAYRRGGWETPSSTAEAPVYETPQYQRQGVRSRMLTHGWVYCRWGRTQDVRDGRAGLSGCEKMHGDAWRGGFVNFTDVEGVPDWMARERQARREETTVADTGKRMA